MGGICEWICRNCKIIILIAVIMIAVIMIAAILMQAIAKRLIMIEKKEK